jgi:hypothetical protein
MLEPSGGQARARRRRDAVLRIGEHVRQRRAAMQDDARRTHRGWDSEQSGRARGRAATQRLVRGRFRHDPEP